ncbi:MAG: phosphoribosylformylglycinamidine synthase [Tissierellia bacterium]|nr:phosphoribosylformylglycinamidine synthase [Tissierellia bacterium]
MKILIVGSGGREHALGYKINLQNPESELFFAPGNGGTKTIGKNIDINADEIEKLKEFAIDENIEFAIIGPEVPLCLGLADSLEKNGIKVFGVLKEAAKLEGSKSYAKEFMVRNNLPTAEYKKFSDANEAKKFGKELLEKNLSNKVVVKADGLCAGKGVLICENLKELNKAIDDILVEKVFGETNLIVEEYLDGFEISMHCFIDNDSYLMLPDVKDHKRIFEGEKGLNTGGMGTYSPNPQASVYKKEILENIIKPFHKGLKNENIDFRGMIFLGLMVTETGVKVLEFNCRFGDPETQSLMLKFDSNLLEALIKVSENDLKNYEAKFNDKKVITTVLASNGYPQSYQKGLEILGLSDDENTVIFHAGTKEQDGKIFTNGGRVLAVSSASDSFSKAYENVYEKISKIEFENKFYRKDISPLVKRVYISKRDQYDILSSDMSKNLSSIFGKDIKAKIYQRYDIEGLNDFELNDAIYEVLAKKTTDMAFVSDSALQLQKELKNPLVISSKPGQFEIREYHLAEILKLKYQKRDIYIKSEKVIEFEGIKDSIELKRIENLLINPVVEERGKLLDIPTKLSTNEKAINRCIEIEGFKDFDDVNLKDFLKEFELAMSLDDLKTIRDYFKSEDRNPNIAEIKILDTYWSDHCRHTTFNTILEEIQFEESDQAIDKTKIETFEKYLAQHEKYRKDRPITLMDLATINQKVARETGFLDDLDISEEINACSINIDVDVDGEDKNYLLMFKNETHNHPTEIEPFGGAATCLGGAIRDPLSGRSYVYQAMRITGAGDILEPIEKTLPGKLPQSKITTDASDGYSSYGNQIGIATGYLDEIYHPGFVAKRMELGAVMAAVPKENVIREEPKPGDIVLLVGARTGRDGVGGATGSSKVHTEESADESSAEVQKGNAPIERNIQRLFRHKELANMIKRCNDFGAGGVSVAIGELADSLEINLEKVLLKYSGISPRDIAISESQERMAVVIKNTDEEKFKKYCEMENVEVSKVAKITDSGYMVIKYGEEIIAKLSREFLNSAGAKRYQNVSVPKENIAKENTTEFDTFKRLVEKLSSLNGASKKNLIEKFDSTIGARTIIAPLGGKNQIAPAQGMAAKIPVDGSNTETVAIMTYGYDPYLFEKSTFLGGYYAVCESLTKLAAMGADPLKARLTFQEYFQRLENDEEKWALPLTALLGAFKICDSMNTPPIGGKDSMSGTFENINVPPTLVSFAIGTALESEIITSELKGDYKLGLITTDRLKDLTLDEEKLKENFKTLKKEAKKKNIVTAIALNRKGLLPLICESAFGNDYGFEIDCIKEKLFEDLTGSFLVEYREDFSGVKKIGKTIKKAEIKVNSEKFDYEKLKDKYLHALDEVFKPETKSDEKMPKLNKYISAKLKSKKQIDCPKVIIPIAPGDNCEEELKKAFESSGAEVETFVIKTLNNKLYRESINKLSEKISNSQILALSGGFSFGDEPDSSGDIMANILKEDAIKSAVEQLLNENDGLILGINSGFSALLQTGLLPFGKYQETNKYMPALSFNKSGRHIAKILPTKVISKNSPWLANLNYGEIYNVPCSTTEGRFVIGKKLLDELIDNNQIAIVFEENPTGSENNIEAIMSQDGKIFGKICHTERLQKGLYKNIPNMREQDIFKAAVDYFKK